MFDLIKEIMNVSYEVWRWVHKKYGISRIVRKLYSVETKKSLTLMFSKMFKWIDETINGSDKLWGWVYQNYGISQIVQNNYWVKTNIFTYLGVPDDGLLNRQKNKTYDLQWKNSNNNNRLYNYEFYY